MIGTEIIRHGGTLIDAHDQINRIPFEGSSLDVRWLYRKVKFIAGEDKLKVTEWIISKTLPEMDTENDISYMVINIFAIREKVVKMLTF